MCGRGGFQQCLSTCQQFLIVIQRSSSLSEHDRLQTLTETICFCYTYNVKQKRHSRPAKETHRWSDGASRHSQLVLKENVLAKLACPRVQNLCVELFWFGATSVLCFATRNLSKRPSLRADFPLARGHVMRFPNPGRQLGNAERILIIDRAGAYI